MKITRVGSAFVLTAALVAGGLVAPSAHADEAVSTEEYLVSLVPPANAAWASNREVFASSAASVADVMKRSGIKVAKSFTSVGVISAEMTGAQAASLKKNPDVLSVSRNLKMYPAATQTNAPWHLDRLDQDEWDHDNRDGEYWQIATGKGVTGYVIDSGIDPNWPDIKGRVLGGQNFTGDGYGWKGCETVEHGTKVATSMGGTTYGVAKDIKFHSLRVFPCQQDGTAEMLIDALDWVVKNGKHPSVVNLSLSFRANVLPPVDEAVQRVFYSGFPVVVPAGNESIRACSTSPARAPEAITVAASNYQDREPFFSNYGACVDLYAPGEGIQFHDSTQYNDDGTSYSAAMVAGAIAQYMDLHPEAIPSRISRAVVDNATKSRITNSTGGTPNLLLNTAFPPRPPLEGLEVSFDKVKVAGTHAFVWGYASPHLVAAWTEALTPNGWQKSQTRAMNAAGYFRIPLTYNMHKAGEHTFRVGVAGEVGPWYSEPFTITRRQLTVTVPSKAKVNVAAYLQGKVPTALNRTVRVQVLDNGKWVTTNTVTASSTGYVKVLLDWKKGTPGTYTFRAIFTTPYGPVYSKGAKLTRYR